MKKLENILITGGAGFVGSHLVKKCLKKGFNVRVLSRSDKKIDNLKGVVDKIELIIKDIRDIKRRDIENIDCIFHLAGTTHNYSILEDPYVDIEINCKGTISLLESCKKHNQNTRIVLASTFFVNGNVEKLPVNSNSPCNPLGIYGATRLAAENFCRIYHNVFGLDTLIARFTNVFGPYEQAEDKKKAGFTYLINLALKGKDILVYNNGDFFRDYIYVEDVADACLTLAEKGETNKIYYVGRGDFVKFKKLAEIVAKETGVNIKSIEPPDFHKKVGITDFVSDNSDLMALGWKPKVSLEEGIRNTIDYYRKIQIKQPDN